MKSITSAFERIELVEKTNIVLMNRITALEARFDDLEQRKRDNSVILHGLQNQTEPLNVAVKSFFIKSFVNVKLEGQITNCIKLKPNNTVSPILIKFSSSNIKKELLKLRSKNADIMKAVNNGSNVFLNEDLTPFRRNLLNEARTVKTLKNYKYLWTRNGNIMLRKDTGGTVVFIKSKDDLCKIV
jgi:hypothetical protein